MKRWLPLLLLGFAASTSGCTPPRTNQDQGPPPPGSFSGRDQAFIEKLQQLQARNPVQDAQAAIAGGRRYLLCNAGRSRTVPGLTPEAYQAASASCPTECLDGVTDALFGPNHAAYLKAALDYSATWNRTMLPACR
ncbi:MAG TPA: hypothetical protein PLB10_12290 [Thiolinea sp.]|nr:hypothetical protein [Thiolinea sp.]